jgi:hypothetical protein
MNEQIKQVIDNMPVYKLDELIKFETMNNKPAFSDPETECYFLKVNSEKRILN